MSEFSINVGVRTEDRSTGERKPKDITKAIKNAVAGLLMKREAPGAVAVDMVSGDNAVKGVVTMTGQPSQASGRFMYYMEGKIDIGPFQGLTWTGNIMLPDVPSNYLDDDTLKLYQTAKKAQGSEKDIATLKPEQIALLAKHGVVVKRKA